MYVGGYMNARANMWRSEDNIWESNFSFHHMSGYWGLNLGQYPKHRL